MNRFIFVFVIAAASSAAHASYEVTPAGFMVRHEIVIQAAPARVYESLTRDLAAWWDPRHTYSGDSRNLSLDLRPGGCFCERLPDGGVEHMRVVQVKANDTLRLTGALGPLQASGLSGSMTWRVLPADNGSRIELTYVVGGYMPGGFEKMAPAVERVLGEQVDRLKRYVETGAPAATK